MTRWSEDSITTELPRLLDDRGLSLRRLGEEVGVDATHLSRALRRQASKRVSGELAGRLATALELPIDYFPEYREAQVIEAVRTDGALRDRLYRRLGR